MPRALGRLLIVVHHCAANYRTAGEYEGCNLQYSLTRRGEAVLAGVLQAVLVEHRCQFALAFLGGTQGGQIDGELVLCVQGSVAGAGAEE